MAFDPIGTVVDWIDACRQRSLAALVDLYDDAANSPLRRRTSKTRHERLLIIRVIQECREYKQKWDVKHEI